ncbi:transmembrane 9 superfamily member 4 isoform X2 [Lactuca sativa]|uniref:transmembrane 9 superfamily member 4 isoform X2 n=2 Tax=Lactuca sativa TaxID=4236 RepID=UPI000CD81EB6|nr:transmembrane 9 superfamily member 4 isoform X2 [Lactuca sativa]
MCSFTVKGMVHLRKYPFLILLLIYLGIQVESDASDHRYSEGDIVPFYANKIGPISNSWEIYAYYELPYCSQDDVKEKKLNLGEMLNGDHLVSTPYKLEFLVDKDFEVLCNKTLSKTDVSKFRRAIEKDYYMQLYYDDLPMWAFIGIKLNKGDLNERIKKGYSLSKHFDFHVFYNKDRVIEVNLQVAMDSLADITEDKEVDVSFTYSVKWTMTQKSFDRRMEKYIGSAFLPHHMSIHHHSVTFSSVILLILIISLLTFYLLVLRKDISKNSVDVEEDQVISNQEEIGWKNVHGDVFRFPQHKSLFAAALGAGTQLLILIIAILALGLLGFFKPYIRGVLWNALIIVYAVTSLVSGYTSGSFYCQLEGTNWMKNIILTGGLYLGPLFLTFTFLDIVAIFYGSTTALPPRAIVMLSLSWIFIASPLLLLGGIIGKTRMSEFQSPCKTAKIPREVPTLRWYKDVLPQMVLAGILPYSVINIQLYYIFESVWGHRIYILYSIISIVFFLLLIMTALVSVALTYFQLAVEDHQWWWRSFLSGGSTGLYIYVYCIYYSFKRSEMNGFMQISFYFGYMACVCFGIFLLLGSVGFRASLLFVRYLYAAIKCD